VFFTVSGLFVPKSDGVFWFCLHFRIVIFSIFIHDTIAYYFKSLNIALNFKKYVSYFLMI
jgi:hypothetical protein